MWQAIQTDIRQRLLNFESFNGAFIFVPWGAGFIYCAHVDQKNGYQYAMYSAGVALIVWGLRKTMVNRVKQQAKVELMVQEAKSEMIVR